MSCLSEHQVKTRFQTRESPAKNGLVVTDRRLLFPHRDKDYDTMKNATEMSKVTSLTSLC